MENPDLTTATRLREYIAFMLPWAHGHQLKAIGDYVAAIIEQQTACQAQLARYFGNQEAASIMASATPFWCCATPKHLTAKSGMISKP